LRGWKTLLAKQILGVGDICRHLLKNSGENIEHNSFSMKFCSAFE
jgi:hypothetical protein